MARTWANGLRFFHAVEPAVHYIPVILHHVHALRKHLKWCARTLHLPVMVTVRSDFVTTIMTSPRSHPEYQTITQRCLLSAIFVSNMTMQNQGGRT
jgi:hypothetical protein